MLYGACGLRPGRVREDDLGLGADRGDPVPGLLAGLQAAEPAQADQLGEDDRAHGGPRPPGPSSGRRWSCRRAASSRPPGSPTGCARPPRGASRPCPPRRWSMTRRSQATIVLGPAGPAGLPPSGESSRCVCALTNPGVMATLPRSRSAPRSRAGPIHEIRPSSTVRRPSAIGVPLDREDVTRTQRQRRPFHRWSLSAGAASSFEI